VIEFKRDVYTLALNELATFIFKRGQDTRPEAEGVSLETKTAL
jgi:hypothetical protein